MLTQVPAQVENIEKKDLVGEKNRQTLAAVLKSDPIVLNMDFVEKNFGKDVGEAFRNLDANFSDGSGQNSSASKLVYGLLNDISLLGQQYPLKDNKLPVTNAEYSNSLFNRMIGKTSVLIHKTNNGDFSNNPSLENAIKAAVPELKFVINANLSQGDKVEMEELK